MELYGINGTSAMTNTAVKAAEQLGDSVFFGLLSAYAAQNTEKTEAAEQIQTPSLEEMLRAKYPRIAYHVFDASSGYWKTRNDYPHYLLYRDDGKAAEVLENWKPSGPNPFYGSIDGKFIAPKEIRALGSIPPGSRAVVIHPKVQERMEEEPEYALELMARIEAWWAFDSARNEAMMPGIEARSSWSVAIGEDGNIVNAQSHSAGEITTSKSGKDDDDEKSFWELRLERHAYFMEQITKADQPRGGCLSPLSGPQCSERGKNAACRNAGRRGICGDSRRNDRGRTDRTDPYEYRRDGVRDQLSESEKIKREKQ